MIKTLLSKFTFLQHSV